MDKLGLHQECAGTDDLLWVYLHYHDDVVGLASASQFVEAIFELLTTYLAHTGELGKQLEKA
jgi:hypothetical protein